MREWGLWWPFLFLQGHQSCRTRVHSEWLPHTLIILQGLLSPNTISSKVLGIRSSLYAFCAAAQPPQSQPTRLLCPWDSPGKKTGAGCHALFQRTFPTQGSTSWLLHGSPSLLLDHLRSPVCTKGHPISLSEHSVFLYLGNLLHCESFPTTIKAKFREFLPSSLSSQHSDIQKEGSERCTLGKTRQIRLVSRGSSTKILALYRGPSHDVSAF